jgi:hypothetical protein
MNAKPNSLLKSIYGLAAVVVLFTGFGNMPLWGRYYVADIPGLGWSGDFIVNVNIHIIAGSMLLGLGVYFLTESLVKGSCRAGRLTLSGKIRGGLLGLALMTGILMVVKNLPGIHFSLVTLMVFNFTHMGVAVLFMLAALVALIFKQPWRRTR